MDDVSRVMAASGSRTGTNQETPTHSESGQWAPGTVMDLLCNLIQSLQKTTYANEDLFGQNESVKSTRGVANDYDYMWENDNEYGAGNVTHGALGNSRWAYPDHNAASASDESNSGGYPTSHFDVDTDRIPFMDRPFPSIPLHNALDTIAKCLQLASNTQQKQRGDRNRLSRNVEDRGGFKGSSENHSGGYPRMS